MTRPPALRLLIDDDAMYLCSLCVCLDNGVFDSQLFFFFFNSDQTVVSCKMHRCLNIVEVQRSIFRQVDSLDHQATLAGLARTCRAFSGAALDVLWATLDSFVYLIRCLPRDLWKIEFIDRRMVCPTRVNIISTDPG